MAGVCVVCRQQAGVVRQCAGVVRWWQYQPNGWYVCVANGSKEGVVCGKNAGKCRHAKSAVVEGRRQVEL